jgi:uncharacterized protein YcbX
MAITVRGLAITAVKGTRLQAVDRIALDAAGVRENRRFYLVDDGERMVNTKHLGELNALIATYSEPERRLAIAFPDGEVIEGEVRPDGPVSTRFYSRTEVGRLVEGPWSAALSEYAGQPLRLVEASRDGAVDRGSTGAASLISRASLDRLAELSGRDGVDSRRFRMLIEIDGIEPHAEDEWVGRTVRIGEAAVRFEGHVGRCLITSRDPDTGRIDLPTLDILGGYRRDLGTTEPLAFGIFGSVAAPGTVRVGDRVTPDG